MTVKSAVYFWAVCDGVDCNSRCPNDDVQAWDDWSTVEDSMQESDWRTSPDGHHYCLDCWLHTDDDNLVFNDGCRAAGGESEQ